MIPRFVRTRAAVLIGVLALTLAVQLNSAGAAVGWCRSDPVLHIGDRLGRVLVASTGEIDDPGVGATGPTEVAVTVPSGVSVRLLATDKGFGFGYTVTVGEGSKLRVNPDGSIPVQIEVRVPAATTLPVLAEFVPAGSLPAISLEGTTNAVLTFVGTV